jgi:hypothetical protein
MTTTRRPVELPSRLDISERAVQLHLEMERLRLACHCEPVDPVNWRQHECEACVARRRAHVEIHNELGLRPWFLILDMYSPGKPLWKALETAARELRLVP